MAMLPPESDPRYARQQLLPRVGATGQARLKHANVAIVGLGALGTVAADLLARAGVGRLRLIDRDVVELSNLQRQTLYTTADANAGLPKVQAAAARLSAIDPGLEMDLFAVDLNADNARELLVDANVILDATDNAQTRYLINDLATELAIPWVYGGAVGVEGRVTAFRPGQTTGGPCLRCLFREPPAPGELPTCDTAGVLATVTSTVAALQTQFALRLLLEPSWVPAALLSLNIWDLLIRTVSTENAREPGCPCCGAGRRDFLAGGTTPMVSLCGRQTIQILAPVKTRLNLSEFHSRWSGVGVTQLTPFLLRLTLESPQPLRATLFADGRMLLEGIADFGQARGWYDRLVGT